MMNIYKVKLADVESKTRVIMKCRKELVGQTIIYVHRRKDAVKLRKELVDSGYAAITLGDDHDRDKLIREFKQGLTQVLVMTYLLASEFDQSQVNLVVNFDLPAVCVNPTEPFINEVYSRRINGKGVVFNLLCGDNDNMVMDKINTHFNHNVTEVYALASDDVFKNALKGLV